MSCSKLFFNITDCIYGIPLNIETFWRDRENIEQTLLLISIITVIISQIDTYYNKIPYRILDLSGEKYAYYAYKK